ncbi:MAG: HDOD domain-containing protein [Desulfuromonadales bacterium]
MAVPVTIKRLLVLQPIDLPVFHPIALKMVHLLENPDFVISDLVSTANDDQVLAGQILKMANSHLYSGRIKVETVKDAFVRLGAYNVSNLAMAASQAALHVSKNEFVNGIMLELWLHSHACALGCQWVAMNCGQRNIADQAYLAGLVHDVGKLHLLKALERLTNAGLAQAALERGLLLEIFNEMHLEHGSRLMEHWNMPPVYRMVAARHNQMEISTDTGSGDMVLAIVRLVNIATRKRELSLSTEENNIPILELPEAVKLRMTDVQLMELYSVLEKSREVGF